jgi:hypothetical protein
MSGIETILELSLEWWVNGYSLAVLLADDGSITIIISVGLFDINPFGTRLDYILTG